MGRKRLHATRPLCACGRAAKIKGYSRRDHLPYWGRDCGNCRRGYLAYRKTECESCGWKPPTVKALEVDHIDGNHRNSDPSNLRTLCPNCHRLKTLAERDLLAA